MTDTSGYIPPEIVEGGGDSPPPRDENDQYICDWPGCDRTFPKYMGVVMHKRRVHIAGWSTRTNPAAEEQQPVRITPSGYPVRERCSLCGKPITAARMQSHLRRVHNATISKKQPTRTRVMPDIPTSATRTPAVTAGPNVPMERADVDENWEKMATVRRASAEFVRLTAERADFQLNLDQFVVDDDVVILKSSDGSRWMLRRID